MEDKIGELLAEFSWIWQPDRMPEPLLIYEEEKTRLIRLSERQSSRSRITLIRGRKGSGRKLLVKHVAHHCGKAVYFIECELLLARCMDYGEEFVRFFIQQLMQSWIVCFCIREINEDKYWEQILLSCIRSGMSCFVLSEEEVILPRIGEYEKVEMVLKDPEIGERIQLWEHFLKKCEGVKHLDASKLGNRYYMNGGEIKRAICTAALIRDSYGRTELNETDIIEAVKMHCKSKIGEYAKKIPEVFTWEDLVASDSLRRSLENLCGQVKYREIVGEKWGFYEKRPYGNGVCALFYGPPGTGKTMAAQVVARELGMELYRVDMSRMSSKYIGETQKNISELFQRAKNSNMLLLFDEADAFFSKRTQVKDSNDRHANGEIAHLLQQLEEYNGVTILTTNLKGNLDEAFKRRIKTMIYFPLPDRETRICLWKKSIPSKAPVSENLDITPFAERFELSGSEIKEIMLAAAFLAAAEQAEIGEEQVKEALTVCFSKYGRVLTEADFRWR